MGAAAWATAPNGYLVAGRFETIRNRDGWLGGVRQQIDIVSATAFVAIKVVMVQHVGAIAPGHAVQIDFPNQPAFHEGIEAIVNRGHGNLRHSPFRPHKDLLRRRMIAPLEQHIINVLALRRGPQAPRGEPLG